jgi:hypothetical protein
MPWFWLPPFAPTEGAAGELIRLAISREFSVPMDYEPICDYRDVALRSRHIPAPPQNSGGD